MSLLPSNILKMRMSLKTRSKPHSYNRNTPCTSNTHWNRWT